MKEKWKVSSSVASVTGHRQMRWFHHLHPHHHHRTKARIESGLRTDSLKVKEEFKDDFLFSRPFKGVKKLGNATKDPGLFFGYFNVHFHQLKITTLLCIASCV